MKYTIGADLLIKTETLPRSKYSTTDDKSTQIFVEADSETNKSRSETWLIPVHRKVISAKIPYFGGMFRNNWRHGEELIGSTEFVLAPDHISANIVLAYVAAKYHFIEIPESRIDSVSIWIDGTHGIDVKSTGYEDFYLELMDLATFWSDEAMKTKLLTYFDDNMNSSFISKIYDHPRLHDILKPTVLKHFEKLESAAKNAENLLKIEKKKNVEKREFFWFQTVDEGLQVYSGKPADQRGTTNTIYKIRAVTSFKKLMISFCTQQGLMIEKRQFKFGERIVIGSNTAESLELKDGDVISVSRVDVSMSHLE